MPGLIFNVIPRYTFAGQNMARFERAADVKTGVVGYGAAFEMGRRHLSDLRKAGMTPCAVAETDPERLDAAGRDFPGIEQYRSVPEMLRKSDVNLVVLITPHNTHAKLGLQCLRAGRHVISEKPFAITTAECDSMIREASARNLLLTAYHNRHWDGCVLEALKHLHEEKAIGEIYRVDARIGGYGHPGDWWRSSRSISGGIMYDWGVHLLEYALQIIPAEIVEVAGFAKTGFWADETPWKDDTNEDVACAVVRFNNGAWLSLTVSSLEANPRPGQLEVSGTEGSYIFDGRTYEMVRKLGSERVVKNGTNTASRWEAFYQNIAEHLTEDKELVITPEWARRPIHILDLAVKSAKQGRAMKARYK